MALDLADFCRSLADEAPPAGRVPTIAALWYGAKGEWDKAHAIVQNQSDADAAWVHAWLHRVEGDLSNARYWYGKAGRAEAEGSTETEWATIASTLLEPKG